MTTPDADTLWPLNPSPDHTTLRLAAQVAHEAVRIYSMSLGEEPSQPWPHLSEEAQIGIIMAAVSVTQGASVATLHARWMATRLRLGWTFGPELNRAKMAHPNLRPWAELPHAQQCKTRIFARTVHANCLALAPTR